MRAQCAISTAVMTLTRTITVAAGVFAPGHLGELTWQVPFEPRAVVPLPATSVARTPNTCRLIAHPP